MDYIGLTTPFMEAMAIEGLRLVCLQSDAPGRVIVDMNFCLVALALIVAYQRAQVVP